MAWTPFTTRVNPVPDDVNAHINDHNQGQDWLDDHHFQNHVNVMADFGAVGDGVADDTAAIQAAIDSQYDNRTGGAIENDGTKAGTVFFPNYRTYRITDTIFWDGKTNLIGGGNRAYNGSSAGTRILWDGATSKAMFEISTTDTNIAACRIEYLTFIGGPASTPVADYAFHFRSNLGPGRPDIGFGFTQCNFQRTVLANVKSDQGCTNIYFEDCHFTASSGYGLHVDVNTSSSFINMYRCHYNSQVPEAPKGWIFLDGEAITQSNVHAFLNVIGAHIEINGDLEITYSAGSTNWDKRSIIRCGVDETDTARLQHHIRLADIRVDDGVATDYSLIGATSVDGTTDDHNKAVNITIEHIRFFPGVQPNGQILGGFNSDATYIWDINPQLYVFGRPGVGAEEGGVFIDERCFIRALTLNNYTNATRPNSNTFPVGTMIWNTDDNMINVSNGGGTWYDATGTPT